MSGGLVPARSGRPFEQQGQVDWVSLSGTTIAFTFDVVARLAKADLHLATIGVGGAIASKFALDLEAQKRIRDALEELPSFKSYGNLVWFGFGIRPIVRDLADSEHGMACVSLCACLAVSYDTFFAAGVLRELCRDYDTPQEFMPSIHQWHTLVKVCAGSLTKSNFPKLVEGLMRLALPCPDISLREPTSRQALAKVIGALSDLSRKKIASVTIAGGVDCLWLAAVAEWMLCLSIEIDVSGRKVYQSSDCITRNFAQVTVILDSDSDLHRQPALMSKCYSLPSGSEILQIPGRDQSAFLGGRSPWDQILSRAFGPAFTRLLQDPLLPEFFTIIRAAALHAEKYYLRNSPDPGLHQLGFRLKHFHFGNRLSRGQDFVAFAANCLPELALLAAPIGDNERFYGSDWQKSMEKVRHACGCQSCGKGLNTNVNIAFEFCLKEVTETIIIFLWMLSSMDVHELILPSPHGLKLFHAKLQNCVSRPEWFESTIRHKYSEDILSMALILFSGPVEDASLSGSSNPSALSANGICVYFCALDSLDVQPERASTIRVTPGYIEFNGTIHTRVVDIPAEQDVGTVECCWDINPPFELLVQEPREPGSIRAAYRIFNHAHSYERILGIFELRKSIAALIQHPVRCPTGCQHWNFPHHPRESLKFTTASTPDNSGFEKQHALNFGWSVIFARYHGTRRSKRMNLEVVSASMPVLYSLLVRNNDTRCLTNLQTCLTCLVRFFHSFNIQARVWKPQQGKRPLADNVTLIAQGPTGRWKKNEFRVSKVRDGDSVLDSAVASKDATTAEELISRKHDLDYRDQSGNTWLHRLVNAGDDGMVQLLLSCGASIDAKATGSDSTPLHISVRERRENVMNLLVENGCDLDLLDSSGYSAVAYAIELGEMAMVEVLVKKGAILHHGRSRPLHIAISKGDEIAAKFLLQNGADPNFGQHDSPLHIASRSGCENMVKLLLEHGANANASHNCLSSLLSSSLLSSCPLAEAAQRGYAPVVKLLLDKCSTMHVDEFRRSSAYWTLKKEKDKEHIAIVAMIEERTSASK